ncbi:MAG TPA: GNAT family N-acetyltransferase [Armatimonadota bacterium]|nr:GNAT family N-acetyltransferase [Armatimonadota bacterium]
MNAFDSQQRPEIIVRQATRKDLESIGDLWVELMSFHSRLDQRFGIPPQGRSNYIRHTYQAIRDHNYAVLVAENQDQILGYVIGYIAQNPPIFPQPQYGFIADICVTHHARRQGVGESLVKTLRDWFRMRGMDSVQLNVAHHNPVSQAFWRKMGCTDYIDHMWMRLDNE